MCGIAGIVDYSGCPVKELQAAVARMCDAMTPRGPDDFGIQTLSSEGSFHYSMAQPGGVSLAPVDGAEARTVSVVLGNRRLAIIDLTASGHQPMCNRDGTGWVTYNGEIYNFRELREVLGDRGHRFNGSSDTEVLVHGYDEWGIDGLLHRLRGMFAFALWDTKRSVLVLARDRYGIKPLYYLSEKDRVIFASEVRTIAASGMVPLEANTRARIAFLLTGSVPVPWTTLKSVRALPAGHYLLCGAEGEKLVQYYQRERDVSWLGARTKAFAPELPSVAVRRVLEEAVGLHLISDAPLGVFLSGGIDSSAVTALAAGRRHAPLTTLSIVFEEAEYSEARYQRAVAMRYGTDHREVLVRARDFWDELPNVFRAMDQPSIDGVNTYFVARAARQAGLKAVLSGLGGDEVFCGYPTFRWIGRLRKLQKFPALVRVPLRWSGKLPRAWRRLKYLTYDDPLSLYLVLRGVFTPSETAQLLGCEERQVLDVLAGLAPSWRDEAPEAFLQRMEFDWYMQNQLLKDTDVMSMAHSVEIRVPLLDHCLVEMVGTVRNQWNLNGRTPKSLLVGAMDSLLPRELVHRPKQGFTFPFAVWLRGGNGRDLLGEGKTEDRLWGDFVAGRCHWSRVWAVAVCHRSWGASS